MSEGQLRSKTGAPLDEAEKKVKIPFEHWTAIANYVFDEILPLKEVPHAAKIVLFLLFRKTVGWNTLEVDLSFTDIQNYASVSRNTAIHATDVICDCWRLFIKGKGQEGKNSYRLNALTPEDFGDRFFLVQDIYGTGFPTHKQLAAKPCTEEIMRQARIAYKQS